MRPKSFILLFVALVLGLGTAFFVRSALLNKPQAVATQGAVPVEQKPKAYVLVAEKHLPTGTFVKADAVKWMPWPEESLSDAYFTIEGTFDEGSRDAVLKDLDGAVTRRPLEEGQPLIKSQMVHAGDRGFLAAVLSPGYRAVSVPVNATSGIAGFVFPGDKIDLLCSLKLRGNDQNGNTTTRFASLTLAKDVRVLAMDQVVENEDSEARVAKTATLEVTPKQAEKVVLAMEMGSLSLSLRSLSGNSGDDEEISLSALQEEAEKMKKAGRNFTVDIEVFTVNGHDISLDAARPKGKKSGVDIVRGTQTEKAVF